MTCPSSDPCYVILSTPPTLSGFASDAASWLTNFQTLALATVALLLLANCVLLALLAFHVVRGK